MSLFESASLVVTPNGAKASKLYAIKPTSGAGDLSVTRATTATRVNSAGLIESVAVNVPRLDYTNSTCPSILVEPQRTNINLYSEDLTNLFYGKTNCTISSNSVISPDGTQNADTATFSSGGQFNFFYAFSGNTNVSFSFFVKKGNYTSLNILEQFYFATSITFNLDTKTATVGGKVEDYGNGWLRCSWVQPYGIAQTIISWRFAELTGTAGFAYFYGFQAEAGSYPTSYIPTTSASVTRNADVISKTGISSLIGQTEGTIFFNYIPKSNYPLTEQNLLTLYDSSGVDNNNLQFFIGTGNIIIYVVRGGSLQTNLNTGVSPLASHKIALSYNNNDLVVYIDGVQVGTDTSITVPALNSIVLNNYGYGTYMSASAFTNVALWKTRLSNSELSTLTTI
ncbi:MAG: phage head spike fiber domain-containing protein [Candidatus Fonsibacter sp.]